MEARTIQYSDCFFEARVQRKKSLNSTIKYLYIADKYLAFCSEPYKKIPDLIVDLVPSFKVVWQWLKKDYKPIKIIGFMFRQDSEEYEFSADDSTMVKLKEHLQLRVFQARFQDEYEVITQIGKGNYARVYSIKHRLSGLNYAVKCFEKVKLKALEKGMQSLFNELEIMRTLTNHINVIKLFETFEGENTYYLVMEIVDGTSLYDDIKLHSQKPYEDEEIKDIMKMLISAVGYISSNDIMHRDIKPENILFAKRGQFSELKIVDFGLATFSSRSPYIFPKCGTPGFVAPEIANLSDKEAGYSSICDMFSVGVIFHILLTGEAVFPGKKFNDVLKKNRLCQLDLNLQLYDSLNLEQKNLLAQLLERDPQKRITPENALKHPYFNQPKLLKKMPSFEDLSEKLDLIPDTRPKKKSVFTKAPRIPYLTKENAVDPSHEELNSFVTNQPLYAGEKHNNSQIPKIPDSMYYTIGSLDQKVQTLDKHNQDKNESASSVSPTRKSPTRENKSGVRRLHKDSIQEEQEEHSLEEEKSDTQIKKK